jgi:glutaredoxin
MNIEFFSAECRLCNRTLGLLKQTFPSLQMIVHRQSECVDGSCCALAEKDGVRAVPSLVIDGKVVMVGLPGKQEIKDLAKILEA